MSGWNTPEQFVAALAHIRLENVFNPYRDRCPNHDLATGPRIRRANLHTVLQAALSHPVSDLWVGLELGRKGGRRTGLPLTDETQLDLMGQYWKIDGLKRATSGPAMNEVTAGFVWKAVADHPGSVMFWNAFPFQCHQADGITNRNHSSQEALITRPFLQWMVARARPKRIVALGRSAHAALARAGIDAHYVRHPARNGGPDFLGQIARLPQ